MNQSGNNIVNQRFGREHLNRLRTFEALVVLVLLVIFSEFIGLSDGVLRIQLVRRRSLDQLVRLEGLSTRVLPKNPAIKLVERE